MSLEISNPDSSGFNAFTPEQVYKRIQHYNQAKMSMPFFKLIMLGVLAGGYIGLGCFFFLFMGGNEARFIGGLAFSSGYIIAVLAGSEVFTSNNLESMSWASGITSAVSLFRKWVIVLFSNAIGAVGLGWLVMLSGVLHGDDGVMGRRLIEMATIKADLSFQEAFFRGMLGNMVICIAIWVSFAGRSVTDKLLPLGLVISSVPILNLEHIVASLFYLPLAVSLSLLNPELNIPGMNITFFGISNHVIGVTLGNIVGGSGMVALVYSIIYHK